MAEAHNHHFVPQGYLRSFAEGVGRQARIVAVDRVERKVFRTKVRNIGAARDFNRVDIDGVDPNALEAAFAEFEGPAAAPYDACRIPDRLRSKRTVLSS